MRHRKRVKKLALPSDQRKAMLRSLATSLFQHDEIMTTMPRAKVLRAQADKIVGLAKRGDVHAIRQISKLIYRVETGEVFTAGKKNKELPETVLRRIVATVGPRFKNKTSGYTRVIPAPPRRGDATPMALVQFVD